MGRKISICLLRWVISYEKGKSHEKGREQETRVSKVATEKQKHILSAM